MADIQRKTANLLNINGETDTIITQYITIINNGIKFENVPSGNYARITYSAQYTAGTYHISCVASGSNYNGVRLFSDSSFTGATYNSFYGGYYRDFPMSGFSTSLTFDNDFKIGFIANAAGGATFTISNIMLSTTEADFEPYGWVHSLRKLTTATEAVENPLYSGGTAIASYTIKGNTVQNGTQTPNNPVEVQGVGDKTDNLMPSILLANGWQQGYRNGANGSYNPNHPNGEWLSPFINIDNITSLVVSAKPIGNKSMNIYYYNGDSYISTYGGNNYDGTVFTNFPTGTTKICVALRTGCDSEAEIIQNGYWFMLNAGSTAKPYEPWGYRIPISNNQQTIDIYIGDLPLLKSLDGTAVDEISNGTLTRRVDADGSVLPTPTTTQITMPSISTTQGANSITVDTTVQPSGFTATWTGWHDASVKEWDGSDWQ